MSDLVERLRALETCETELAHEGDCPPEATANWKYAETCRLAAARIEKLEADQRDTTEEFGRLSHDLGNALLEIERLRAERDEQVRWVKDLADSLIEAEGKIGVKNARIEQLEAYALKAFTVVEFCAGEGLLIPHPHFDCDDLLMEGVDLLKVETSEEARASLDYREIDAHSIGHKGGLCPRE